MRRFLCVLCVAGCGGVKSGPEPLLDAMIDGLSDGGGSSACTVHDSVDSCGPACVTCPAGDDRQSPICNGAACDVVCVDDAPRCSDNSCSRLAWTFDGNTLDGITPRAPTGLRVAVRSHNGNLALALDVTNLIEVSFVVPICVTGNLQVQSKTLHAKVFFEGGVTSGNDYYVQAALPTPRAGAYLVNIRMPSGVSVDYAAAMDMSQFSNMATDVVFQAGALGVQFSGTIWFDDIKIE